MKRIAALPSWTSSIASQTLTERVCVIGQYTGVGHDIVQAFTDHVVGVDRVRVPVVVGLEDVLEQVIEVAAQFSCLVGWQHASRFEEALPVVALDVFGGEHRAVAVVAAAEEFGANPHG